MELSIIYFFVKLRCEEKNRNIKRPLSKTTIWLQWNFIDLFMLIGKAILFCKASLLTDDQLRLYAMASTYVRP